MLLGVVMSNACKNESAENVKSIPSIMSEDAQPDYVSDEVTDSSTRAHVSINGLLLTAEVLDEDNWIIGLAWENVGDVPISLPFVSTLYMTIEEARASPFLFEAYSLAGHPIYDSKAIILDKGRHSDDRVFDLSFDGVRQSFGAYDMLCEVWGLSRSMHNAFNDYIYHKTLESGEKRTCFFRFPRFKDDEESGRWKAGEKIPLDFRFFVGEEAPSNNRVTITSGQNALERTGSGRSGWHGEVFSNVVYLEWNSGGERVRWPVFLALEPLPPPEPVKHLLLSLEVIDEEEWIVRLKWKNVGNTPLEVPVNARLFQDLNSNHVSDKPFLFNRHVYDSSRYYGRLFGTVLERGKQGDETIFDASRERRPWNDSTLDGNGYFSGTRPYVPHTITEWIHLPPGVAKIMDFKFPRFESDDQFERWKERQKIPIEFCFKAGEITNSSPPYREVEEEGQVIRRRFPAWQGEVYSNVVVFKWTSGGERIKWVETDN